MSLSLDRYRRGILLSTLQGVHCNTWKTLWRSNTTGEWSYPPLGAWASLNCITFQIPDNDSKHQHHNIYIYFYQIMGCICLCSTELSVSPGMETNIYPDNVFLQCLAVEPSSKWWQHYIMSFVGKKKSLASSISTQFTAVDFLQNFLLNYNAKHLHLQLCAATTGVSTPHEPGAYPVFVINRRGILLSTAKRSVVFLTHFCMKPGFYGNVTRERTWDLWLTSCLRSVFKKGFK